MTRKNCLNCSYEPEWIFEQGDALRGYCQKIRLMRTSAKIFGRRTIVKAGRGEYLEREDCPDYEPKTVIRPTSGFAAQSEECYD